jgi:hypothetical protein
MAKQPHSAQLGRPASTHALPQQEWLTHLHVHDQQRGGGAEGPGVDEDGNPWREEALTAAAAAACKRLSPRALQLRQAAQQQQARVAARVRADAAQGQQQDRGCQDKVGHLCTWWCGGTAKTSACSTDTARDQGA